MNYLLFLSLQEVLNFVSGKIELLVMSDETKEKKKHFIVYLFIFITDCALERNGYFQNGKLDKLIRNCGAHTNIFFFRNPRS